MLNLFAEKQGKLYFLCCSCITNKEIFIKNEKIMGWHHLDNKKIIYPVRPFLKAKLGNEMYKISANYHKELMRLYGIMFEIDHKGNKLS